MMCSVDGCGKVSKAKGFCNSHYLRMYRHGSPMAGGTSPGEVQIFYREIVLEYQGNECLLWPYGKDRYGYGLLHRGDKIGAVSRYLCEDINGAPPSPDHQAAHSCGNGHLGCVTRNHLSWKTRSENQADSLLHGTRSRGERHGQSKLTENQAREILSLRGKERNSAIAKRFGVSSTTVHFIHTGVNWAWISSSKEA